MSGLVVNKCVCISCVSLLHTSLYPLLRGVVVVVVVCPQEEGEVGEVD